MTAVVAIATRLLPDYLHSYKFDKPSSLAESMSVHEPGNVETYGEEGREGAVSCEI